MPALVRGDPSRLRQVLTNLIGNAFKFTQKGEVSARVFVESQTEDEVQLRFSVRDTGIGVPPEKVGLLFEKFSQVDTSITRRFGGTGLSLAISKQLAELMGGQIGVRSRRAKARSSGSLRAWTPPRQPQGAAGQCQPARRQGARG